MTFRRFCGVWLAQGLLFSASALAANSEHFEISAQPLPSALDAFAEQAHIQLLYVQDVVAGLRSNAVKGEMSIHQALDELLRNTGLEAVYVSDKEVTVQRRGADPQTGGKVPAKPARASGSESQSTSSIASGASLEEIIVSAQKREERLQDVPVPVTAMAAAALADRSQFSLQDYYSQVPGLSLTPNEQTGTPTVAIRGITSGDFTNPTVGIMVDDVPFGPSTVRGGGYFAPDLDPSDLARIEVLRGPQGTLYGASSMGGLIKYVTADPSTEAFTGRVQVGLSTIHNSPDVGYKVSGAANIPLTDTLALRASAFIRESPGYVESIRTGERGVNKAKNIGSHLTALWRPSDQFSLKLSALYQDNKLFGSPYVMIKPGMGDLQQDFLPRTGIVNRKFQAYSATAAAELGTFTLTSVTGYSVSQLYDALDNTEILGSLTAMVFPTADTIGEDKTRTDKFSQELRLATPIGTHFDWLGGMFYTHENSPFAFDLLSANSAGEPVGLFYHSGFHSVYAEWAGFTDLTWHVTGTFDIQFGGRESQIRQTFEKKAWGPFVTQVQNRPSPVIIPEIRAREQAFTYLITPSWKISQQLMVYARAASGYRTGGINSVLGAIDFPTSYQPDLTHNYELGAKGSAFDRRLSFEASVYYIDWKQIQLTLTDPVTGQSYSDNASRAKSQGIELSAQFTPVNGLRVGGWISWNDAALSENFPVNSDAYGVSGDRLPYSSRFAANTSLDYEFPLGPFTANVGGTVSYVGSRIGAFTSSPERQVLPSYTKTDVQAGMRWNQWTLNLYVNNLADRRGIMGGGIGTPIPSTFGLIPPRTVGLSLAQTF